MTPITSITNEYINNDTIKQLYGVEYITDGINKIIEAMSDDLYYFTAFIGRHHIALEKGDSVFYLSQDKTTAYIRSGPASIESFYIATVIRGYMSEDKSSTITRKTSLPYVNGCSTKQVFPPERLGDPTLQLLNIPPYSAEQTHHIHSTVRVVYVISGTGRSIVGMPGNFVTEDLYQGKSIILQKMCPHHFETDNDHLIVLPLHVFSSVGNLENNHPMFNGTYSTC